MPVLTIFTSAEPLVPEHTDALLCDLSARLAKHLGKPESYVMTQFLPRTRMTFGGTTAPACYVEIKSVGTMRPEQTEAMSLDVCTRLSQALSVPADRIYIEFSDSAAHLWGWNGSTFA